MGTLETRPTLFIQMRLAAISASLLILGMPSVSSAQDWKDWNKANPTYQQPQSSPVTPNPAPQASPSQSRSLAEAEFTRGFMDTCLKKAPQSYCDCTVKGMLDVDSMDTLMAEANRYNSDSVAPQRWQSVIQACLS